METTPSDCFPAKMWVMEVSWELMYLFMSPFHWLSEWSVLSSATISSAKVLLWVAVRDAWGLAFLLLRVDSEKMKKLHKVINLMHAFPIKKKKKHWGKFPLPLSSGISEEQVLSRLPKKPNSFSTRNFMSLARSFLSQDGSTAFNKCTARI